MDEPVVWERYGTVDIRDISHDDTAELTNFIINCQSGDLVLHSTSHYRQFDIYGSVYKYILDQKQSLIAIDRETNEVIGVILCLIMTDHMRSWTNFKHMVAIPPFKPIFNLFYSMIKAAHSLQPSGTPMDTVQVFRIAVPKYNKGMNWKPRLLNAVTRMASCLKMPCVTHLAFTVNDQIRSLRAGMREQIRCYYLQYIDPETKTRPFHLAKKNELCAIFYRKDIEKVINKPLMFNEYVCPKRKKSSRRYYPKEPVDKIIL